jgi:hypothetical protein
MSNEVTNNGSTYIYLNLNEKDFSFLEGDFYDINNFIITNDGILRFYFPGNLYINKLLHSMSLDYFYEFNDYSYIRPVDTIIPSVENKQLPQQDLSKYDSDMDDCICNKRKGKYLNKLNTSLINHKKKNKSNKKNSSLTKKKKKIFAKIKSREIRNKAISNCLFDDDFYDDFTEDIQNVNTYHSKNIFNFYFQPWFSSHWYDILRDRLYEKDLLCMDDYIEHTMIHYGEEYLEEYLAYSENLEEDMAHIENIRENVAYKKKILDEITRETIREAKLHAQSLRKPRTF